MWRYLELLSFKSIAEIARWKKEVKQGANPRDVKVKLAKEIVARFHGQSAAKQAHEAFVAQFRLGALPEDISEICLFVGKEGVSIAGLLKESALTTSTSEALRMIKQGAVRIDGERIENQALQVLPGITHIVQVGKRRFARVSIQFYEDKR
jgi:tyrosyl-tRNA synthetase